MRKWNEIYSVHFLIFSLFSPSLSISYIKNCLILAQMLNTALFVEFTASCEGRLGGDGGDKSTGKHFEN